MCTLILGVDLPAPRSVLLAANRDEDPARPSDPPCVLRESPRLAGGRDARSGGTWLAIRGREAAVALLNRRAGGPAPASPRSRGLLAMEVAAAGGGPGDPLASAAEARLREEVSRHAFAAFSLVFASPRGCWIATHDPGAALEVRAIGRGWHVVTHEALDDPGEPRTRALVADLAGWKPPTPDRATLGLTARLALHAGERAGIPDVCIHAGRMPTVSASLVWLTADRARYLHAEGRPCVAPWNDHSALLDPPNGDPAS